MYCVYVGHSIYCALWLQYVLDIAKLSESTLQLMETPSRFAFVLQTGGRVS
jgi:hypothetical protein